MHNNWTVSSGVAYIVSTATFHDEKEIHPFDAQAAREKVPFVFLNSQRGHMSLYMQRKTLPPQPAHSIQFK